MNKLKFEISYQVINPLSMDIIIRLIESHYFLFFIEVIIIADS